jgi:hypothetical protein
VSDIFLSYSRKDRPIAAAMAEILPHHGWTVYWDRQLRAGEIFDEVLEREVTAARCVVVLWSSNSVASHWVRNEADVGACRNALISVLIENVTVPLAFRRVQAADLAGWTGDRNDPRLLELLQAIGFFLGGRHSSVLSNPAVAPTVTNSSKEAHAARPAANQFDPVVLEVVERHLADYVGPIARTLVAGSAVRNHGLPSLYQDLAQHVPPLSRGFFLQRRKEVEAEVAGAQYLPVPLSKEPWKPPSAVWVTELTRDLAKHVGPFANFAVDVALLNAGSREEFLESASRQITDAKDRQAFLQHWRR